MAKTTKKTASATKKTNPSIKKEVSIGKKKWDQCSIISLYLRNAWSIRV
jgi:hypothetical protein